MAIKNKTVDIVETFNFVHISLLVKAKQWPLAGKFSEFEYSPKIRQIFVTRSGEFGEY